MKLRSVYWVSALSAIAEFSTGAAAVRYASWFGQRGTQVKNIISLEGGYVVDGGNFTNGAWTGRNILQPDTGLYLQLDLTKSFDNTTDHSAMFSSQPVYLGDGNSPTYFHGAMFHNGRSWFTFAGQPNKGNPSPSWNSVRRGSLPASGDGTTITMYSGSLNTAVDGVNGVHENISAASYTSSTDPGQSKGWFLGGMSRSNYSYMGYPLRTADVSSVLATDTFFEVDMKTSGEQAFFTAKEAPPNQLGARAQGGLVWLPYGSQGILVAFGGTTKPSDIFPSAPPGLQPNNTLMTDILVYDIALAKWYTQTTLESSPRPTQLAAFCTAVVSTSDNNSHAIIVYGGTDGTGKNGVSDDVWILSVPAFEWTKVVSVTNSTTHGRRGSVCFAPNPTSLITIGGSLLGGNLLGSDSFIDVLDLNTFTWTGKYDPSSKAAFSAPAAVVKQLNWPDSNGPGKRVVGRVSDPTLSSLLSTPYPTEIKANYPYASPSTTVTQTPTPNPTPRPKPSNTALIASLATVIPVLVIAAIIAFFCLRRRKQRRNQTRGKDSDVSSWVRKVDRDEKSNGYTESTVVNSPYEDFGRSPVIPAVARKNNDIYEADHANTLTPAFQSPDHLSHKQADRQYFELDNDPRGPTALSSHPTNINGQHSDIRSELGSDKHASELPQASSRENLSVPAGGVVAGTSQPSSISRKPVADRRDSTPLPSPATPNMGHTRGTSDVSSAALTASPNTEMRRSQYIDGLPEQPGHLGEGRLTPTTQGRASAYKENI